jgi:putative acetyltransferase
MKYIRKAEIKDIERIAEIEVFNYRLQFYPIFKEDDFYFKDLTVSRRAAHYAKELESVWVYDDGVVKGFVQVKEHEVKKLFVEPVLQGNGIGAELLDYAIDQKNVNFLWVLEKNKRAMAFYKRHGFVETNEKKYEEDTTEFLVCMKRLSDFE